MANRLKSKIPGLLLAIVLLALLAVPIPVQATGLFSVIDAEVYNGYLEDGDWLIVIEYENTLQPYYGNATPNMSARDAFVLQLTYANGTLIAQTPMPAWEYRPGSIYLNAATTATLEWGVAYNITMLGTDPPGPPGANTTSYTLIAADWRGSNLAVLDDWCLTLAERLENYYGVNLTTPSPTATTNVLNVEGGVIFVTGIPYLNNIRPHIFQMATYTPVWEDTNYTLAYVETLDTWDIAVGATLAGAFTTFGGTIGLDGQQTGAIVFVSLYLALAFGVLGRGHALAGLVMALPVLIVGFYFRLFPFAVLGIVIAVVALLLVRQFYWKTT